MISILMANQKGGVGKTTTAVTIGHGLAQKGFRTLIVDLDPQGHVARSLGFFDNLPGLYNLVHQGYAPRDTVLNARKNLDILPSDPSTERVKAFVVTMGFGREYVLADKLAPILDDYDFIIYDAAPSADILHQSAISISDWLLIPTKLAGLDLDGVTKIISLANTARASVDGCDIDLLCILPTFFDMRVKENAIQLKSLGEKFGRLVWPPIPTDAAVQEAPSFGETLWEYAPRSRAIQGIKVKNRLTTIGGYERVLEMLIEKVEPERV